MVRGICMVIAGQCADVGARSPNEEDNIQETGVSCQRAWDQETLWPYRITTDDSCEAHQRRPSWFKCTRALCPYSKNILPSDRVTDAKIMITEFGRQMPRSGEWKWDSDMAYSAPELLFNDRPEGEPGQSADVWSLGCMICDILGETSLFPRIVQNRDDMIAELVIALGMSPRRWWEQWTRRDEYFYENGALRVDLHRLSMRKLPILPAKIWYLGWGYLSSAEEIEALLELVQGMLMYLPEERMTATQAVHSRWMRIWGWAAMKELKTNPRKRPPMFTGDMSAIPGVQPSIEV